MEENTNPTTPSPSPSTPESSPATPSVSSPTPAEAPKPEKDGSGAVVWVLVSIIVLVILGAGGYYIWSSNQVTDVAPVQTTPAPTASASATPSASDEATMELKKVSNSDETSSIKKDLDNTKLENIDKENSDINKQVQ
jgi:uncharacterized protein HemX